MKKSDFELIEKYLLDCMKDSAHDNVHIYRVLYIALDIAEFETDVNYDVLITACLLHDIGRKEQLENPELNHAVVGAVKARLFLLSQGYSVTFVDHVEKCIKAHRFRSSYPPCSIEEKILFDADKVDVTGVIGIARTLLYQGEIGTPLYQIDDNGIIIFKNNANSDLFIHEYKYKLENPYNNFHTKRGKEIALQRQPSAVEFYNSMLIEVEPIYVSGKEKLNQKLVIECYGY